MSGAEQDETLVIPEGEQALNDLLEQTEGGDDIVPVNNNDLAGGVMADEPQPAGVQVNQASLSVHMEPANVDLVGGPSVDASSVAPVDPATFPGIDRIPLIRPYNGSLRNDPLGKRMAGCYAAMEKNFTGKMTEFGLPTEMQVYAPAINLISTVWKNAAIVPKMSVKEFEFRQSIGRGSYGKVYLALYQGKEVAVKQINHRVEKCHNVYKEVDTAIYLRHDRIAAILGAFHEGCTFIVFEAYKANLTVARRLLTPTQRAVCSIHLLEGLAWMHSKRIIHCDLRPDNCLLDGNVRLRIADFGRAELLPEGQQRIRSTSTLGCEAYQDAVTNETFVYSMDSDVFSAACTIFEALHHSYLQRYALEGATAKHYIDAYRTGRVSGATNVQSLEDPIAQKVLLCDRANQVEYFGRILSYMILDPPLRISAAAALGRSKKAEIKQQYKLDDDALKNGVGTMNHYLDLDEQAPRIKLEPPLYYGMLHKAMSFIHYDFNDEQDNIQETSTGATAAASNARLQRRNVASVQCQTDQRGADGLAEKQPPGGESVQEPRRYVTAEQVKEMLNTAFAERLKSLVTAPTPQGPVAKEKEAAAGAALPKKSVPPPPVKTVAPKGDPYVPPPGSLPQIPRKPKRATTPIPQQSGAGPQLFTSSSQAAVGAKSSRASQSQIKIKPKPSTPAVDSRSRMPPPPPVATNKANKKHEPKAPKGGSSQSSKPSQGGGKKRPNPSSPPKDQAKRTKEADDDTVNRKGWECIHCKLFDLSKDYIRLHQKNCPKKPPKKPKH